MITEVDLLIRAYFPASRSWIWELWTTPDGSAPGGRPTASRPRWTGSTSASTGVTTR